MRPLALLCAAAACPTGAGAGCGAPTETRTLEHPSLDSALTMRIGSKLTDSTLNMTEVLWLGPENRHVYLGSPSITKAPSGRLLV